MDKMKKSEVKAICEKYGMEILRNPITREGWGLRLETKEDIQELDAHLNDKEFTGVVVQKEFFGVKHSAHIYTVTCPTQWFDLWGWRD